MVGGGWVGSKVGLGGRGGAWVLGMLAAGVDDWGQPARRPVISYWFCAKSTAGLAQNLGQGTAIHELELVCFEPTFSRSFQPCTTPVKVWAVVEYCVDKVYMA